jgi:predicted nuclease of predicted toxin-antitoxin system
MSRLLIDSCVWPSATEELRAAGHDVDAVHDWPEDPGDKDILQRAITESRILITLDKDFGELVFFHGAEHCGICRLVNLPAKDHAKTVLHILAGHEKELQAGAIIVAERDRIRIRTR